MYRGLEQKEVNRTVILLYFDIIRVFRIYL